MPTRLAIAIVAAAAACGSPPAPSPTGAPAPAHPPGRVETRSFRSAALGVDKDYVVYLPAGYDADPARRWPVMFYLHGLLGDEHDWTDRCGLATAADTLGLAAIIVMPDGDDGFYTDAATSYDYAACRATGAGLFLPGAPRKRNCVRRRAYETYIVEDLVAHVDATYRTIATRDARGIAGFSMGGFGALQLAIRHPDVFAAAASHSGVVALLYRGPHPFVAGATELFTDVDRWGRDTEPLGSWVRGIFGPDRANWVAHDPAALVDALVPGQLALYLDCGSDDELLLDDGARYVHERLVARGIDHAWHLGPGGHHPDLWRQRAPHSLAFLAAHITPSQP